MFQVDEKGASQVVWMSRKIQSRFCWDYRPPYQISLTVLQICLHGAVIHSRLRPQDLVLIFCLHTISSCCCVIADRIVTRLANEAPVATTASRAAMLG